MSSTALAEWQTVAAGRLDQLTGIHSQATGNGPGRRWGTAQLLLTEGRKLDVGNPRKSALGADFGRLGISLIPALKQASSAAEQQLADLDALVDFRNAIGHGDESKIAVIESANRVRATKSHFNKNRRTLDALAVTMDAVVAAQLMDLLGIVRPW